MPYRQIASKIFLGSYQSTIWLGAAQRVRGPTLEGCAEHHVEPQSHLPRRPREEPVCENHIVSAMTTPIAAAATGKPSRPMLATQSREKTTPPMLAPLSAMDSAAGRVRTNHGATKAFTAAPPIAAQPALLNSVATKSCQGTAALAQPGRHDHTKTGSRCFETSFV